MFVRCSPLEDYASAYGVASACLPSQLIERLHLQQIDSDWMMDTIIIDYGCCMTWVVDDK